MWIYLLALFLVGVIAYVLRGFTVVPIGAVGVLVSNGRRTDHLLEEGVRWLWPGFQRIEPKLFLRERQIDIEKAQYYTRDRARISFDVTLRASVSDVRELANQGPGTYGPFTHDAELDTTHGSEEQNIAFQKLVQNAVRQTVAALSVQEVMFGEGQHGGLPGRIRATLSQTCGRWGIHVLEVLITDVEAEDKGLIDAIGSEVKEKMHGAGKRAAFQAEVQRGSAFVHEAIALAQHIKEATGKDVAIEQLQQHLVSHHFNEQAIQVALKSADGRNQIMQQVYMSHFGVPLPVVPQLPGQVGMGVPALGHGATVRCACGRVGQGGARFCDGCGASIPGQAALPAPQAAATSSGTGWTVGRTGDIAIDGEGISRHHCSLAPRGSGYVVTDLGSANGTYVNGQRLAPHTPTPVSAHDTVGLGRHVQATVQQLASKVQGATRGYS